MPGGAHETQSLPRAPKPSAVAPLLAPSPPNLFVGTSGWAYPSWKPGFYPQGTPARSFLAYYASQLTTVEVNYTFRTLPSATQLAGWLASVPPGFRFSFKAPQRLTHFARLRDCQPALDEFLEAIQPAHDAGKLGPILFQLPPNFAANVERLAAFLQLAGLHRHYSPALAFEFRHESWFAEPVYEVLRTAGAALCIAESENLVTPDVRTATHRYYRLRCPGGYAPKPLEALGAKFTSLLKEGEVFVYLKHEDEPTGALNAVALLTHAVDAGNAVNASAASARSKRSKAPKTKIASRSV